jgi:hypothetical protein
MFRPFFRHVVEPRCLVFAVVTGVAGIGDFPVFSREFGQPGSLFESRLSAQFFLRRLMKPTPARPRPSGRSLA